MHVFFEKRPGQKNRRSFLAGQSYLEVIELDEACDVEVGQHRGKFG
jgi:hypothetical protein